MSTSETIALEAAYSAADAVAIFDTGVALAEAGNFAGAEEAFRRAEQLGHSYAASNLGVVLEQRGDIDGAEAAYRRADANGLADGSFNLASLLNEQGRGDEAESALRRADERGHAGAALIVGGLLEEGGDRVGAEAAYRRAGERGDADGALNLARLLAIHDDHGAAEPKPPSPDPSPRPGPSRMARLFSGHRGRVIAAATGTLVLGLAAVAGMGGYGAGSRNTTTGASAALVSSPATPPAPVKPAATPKATREAAARKPRPSERSRPGSTLPATAQPSAPAPPAAEATSRSTRRTSRPTPATDGPKRTTTATPTSSETPMHAAQVYIGVRGTSISSVQASVQSVQSGIAVLETQANFYGFNRFVRRAQRVDDTINSVTQDLATSQTSGSLGYAEGEVFTATNDLKHAMDVLVVYTHNLGQPTFSRFMGLYENAVREWNGGIRAIWQIAAAGNPPTI